MIAKSRHTEVTPSGKFIYVVRTNFRTKALPESNPLDYTISNKHNNEFSGERYNVVFRNGIGRTTSRIKAKFLSEDLGYIVQIHKDDSPWEEINQDTKSDYLSYDDDDAYEIDEEEFE